ncbi:hypothetical protein [Parasphingorhabdus pacifica]
MVDARNDERNDELLAAADAVERLAGTTTGGEWRRSGLLASRPEVVAHFADGGTEHIAEARAGSAPWITAFSPELAPMLAGWMRSAARADDPAPEAVAFARALRTRLPDS